MAHYITSVFEHVETTEAYGYTFFFYRDERMMPFATMIVQDTEHDRVSNLDRPGVYRLNVGSKRPRFAATPATRRRSTTPRSIR
jgi:hypothetical protein